MAEALSQTPVSPQEAEYQKSIQAPKDAKDQRMSTQNHLMFTEIKDGIVVMRDGSLRMIVLASALNFDLKSPQEQDSIEFSYQGFLNGLHFPIQIVVRSRKLELDNYLDRLEVIQATEENALIAGLMEDYIYNIRGLLEQVNIMNKEFYIVVPYYIEGGAKAKDNAGMKFASLFKGNTDQVQTTEIFEQRKRDLVQRTNLVAQGLAQIGVRAAVLSTQEVIELFYTSYNQEEAISQNLTDIEQMTTPVVERGNPMPQPPQPMPAADPYAAQAPMQAPPPQNPLVGGGQ